MSDLLWSRLCGRALPERYAGVQARAEKALDEAFRALPEPSREAVAGLVASGVPLLLELRAVDQRLYRAAATARGLANVAGRSAPRRGPKNEGFPPEYQRCDSAWYAAAFAEAG